MPAFGQNINTTPGTDYVVDWGPNPNPDANPPILASYGQTITPTAGQTVLTGFTFYLSQTSGDTPAQAQAFVYEWAYPTEGVPGPVGTPLFASSVITMPTGSGFQPVVIDTGQVRLTPGQQYVLFLTTSTVSGQQPSIYSWSMVPGSAYGGGEFYYQNTATDPSLITTMGWMNFAPEDYDLAFIAYLSGKLSLSANAPANRVNVASALNDYFDRGGFIPNELLMLSEEGLLWALKHLSGEVGAGAQQSGIQLMNSFMSLMVDPFADTRNRRGMAGAYGYAPEKKSKVEAAASEAYAKALKAPAAAEPFARRWSVWGSAYGGYSKVDGDHVALGTHGTSTRGWGFAVGADYRASPDTTLGFALAGGGVSWSLADGLGTGKGDAFQAGIYATHWMDNAYVSAALAASWFDMSTERTIRVLGTDVLTGDFDATSWGGRLEGGVRYDVFGVGTTPYAAVQVQRIRTGGYSEAVKSGSNQFALSYDAKSGTATRTELGVRFANDYVMADGGSYSVFSKLAWAHDFDTDRTLTPVFQSMGTSFIVNGAAPNADLALVQLGVEARMANGWSVMAKLGGEFGGDTQTYTAQGRLRYAW